MKKTHSLINKSYRLKDVLLLAIRLVLAYGFLTPAIMKLKNISSVSDWFKSIGILFPTLSAYLVTSIESLGVVLLVLGLFTRWISIPLILTMIIAILSVHLENGFNADEGGFEIPLYYILMLLTIFIFGSGKYSIDTRCQNV